MCTFLWLKDVLGKDFYVYVRDEIVSRPSDKARIIGDIIYTPISGIEGTSNGMNTKTGIVVAIANITFKDVEEKKLPTSRGSIVRGVLERESLDDAVHYVLDEVGGKEYNYFSLFVSDSNRREAREIIYTGGKPVVSNVGKGNYYMSSRTLDIEDDDEVLRSKTRYQRKKDLISQFLLNFRPKSIVNAVKQIMDLAADHTVPICIHKGDNLTFRGDSFITQSATIIVHRLDNRLFYLHTNKYPCGKDYQTFLI